MKNFKFIILLLICVLCSFGCSENSSPNAFAEDIELVDCMIDEFEFENADTVDLCKTENGWVVSGSIDPMTPSQISAYGKENVKHIISIKFAFDKERTIDAFKIESEENTQVYSTDEDVTNYVGSISDLLDNESGEDAFCYLVLPANISEYTFSATYTDSTTAQIKLIIDAELKN